MKRYIRMGFHLLVIFLVGRIVVEDDVNFLIGGRVFDNLVHEGLEAVRGAKPGGAGMARGVRKDDWSLGVVPTVGRFRRWRSGP